MDKNATVIVTVNRVASLDRLMKIARMYGGSVELEIQSPEKLGRVFGQALEPEVGDAQAATTAGQLQPPKAEYLQPHYLRMDKNSRKYLSTQHNWEGRFFKKKSKAKLKKKGASRG